MIVVGGFDMVAKETGSVLIELIGSSKGRNEIYCEIQKGFRSRWEM